MGDTKALRLALKAAEAEEALEEVRAELHAARETKAGVSPELKKRWRKAQEAVVTARQAHREYVPQGARGDFGAGDAVATPASVAAGTGVNGEGV